MDVVVVLVCAALLVTGAFLIALIWAVKSGQFEDTYTPSLRVLLDNETDEGNNGKNRLSSTENQ